MEKSTEERNFGHPGLDQRHHGRWKTEEEPADESGGFCWFCLVGFCWFCLEMWNLRGNNQLSCLHRCLHTCFDMF